MSENSLTQARGFLERLVTEKHYLDLQLCRFPEDFGCINCDPTLNWDILCENCTENAKEKGLDEEIMFDVLCEKCYENMIDAVSDKEYCDQCVDCEEFHIENNDFLEATADVKIKILLSTGGPATRIIFDYDAAERSYDNIELQHQDWYENWQTVKNLLLDEENALDQYVQNLLEMDVPDHVINEVSGWTN